MKILVIRFSSIGDIVLTTPVVRCLRKKFPEAKIDFLIKPQFKILLSENPYISRVIEYPGTLYTVIASLRQEKYDLIIDLHKNIRSTIIRRLLFRPAISYNKLNFRKWLMVRFKINLLPEKHLIDRYFESLRTIGIENDFKPCDFFISAEALNWADKILAENKIDKYYVVVLSSTYYTKRLPMGKILEIIEMLDYPVFLIGGQQEISLAKEIISATDKKLIDFCGKADIMQSAALVRKAKSVLSGDTGMMHIAAALGKKLVSVWGNTIPAFGMYPYYGGENSWNDKGTLFEVKGLKCRPCSKLGKKSCPRGHFRCMNDLNAKDMAKALTE